MVGRSNVGKSSLINALLGRALARTSGTPGKTRLLNVYRVQRPLGRPFYLVDLPGYGYARGATSGRAFESLVHGYFFGNGAGFRESIAGVLLLVDARHPELASDQAAAGWLLQHDAPVIVAGTKVDTLTRKARRASEEALRERFHAPVVPVSAHTGEGLDALWKRVAAWLNPPPR